MAKYCKKCHVINAFKWTGGPDQEDDPLWIVTALKTGRAVVHNEGLEVFMRLDGIISAQLGDYIFQTSGGLLMALPAEEFESTHEEVVDAD